MPEEECGEAELKCVPAVTLLDQGLGPQAHPRQGSVGGLPEFSGPRHQPRRVFSVGVGGEAAAREN